MGDKLKAKLGWITLVSVLLNLFLLGYLVGDSLHVKEKHRRHDVDTAEIKGQLTPQHAKQFKRMMRELRNEDRALRREMDKVKKEAFEAMTGTVFDPVTYEQKVKELHDLHGQRITNRTSAIVKLAPSLSPEERKAVAKQMRRKKRGKRHHDGPPPARRAPPPPEENHL